MGGPRAWASTDRATRAVFSAEFSLANFANTCTFKKKNPPTPSDVMVCSSGIVAIMDQRQKAGAAPACGRRRNARGAWLCCVCFAAAASLLAPLTCAQAGRRGPWCAATRRGAGLWVVVVSQEASSRCLSGKPNRPRKWKADVTFLSILLV